MLYRLFAFLALVAVAFANPKPDPQVVAYTAGGWGAWGAPYTYPYYSGVAAPYAAGVPYAYGGYYVR